jgi:hypothetical protein
MRYLKGSIVLSEAKDYPLLRRVLHCTFVTPDQLFQFQRLDYWTTVPLRARHSITVCGACRLMDCSTDTRFRP